MLRIGIVGYGTGGQHFHTPFSAAAEGYGLAGIMARAEAIVAKAKAGGWPDTPVFPSLTAMIAAGVCDAVTITSPPQTRRGTEPDRPSPRKKAHALSPFSMLRAKAQPRV